LATKHYCEVRDPIHVFCRLDSDELKVLNSRPFQRLRHIHQLALTYLVYPGATHKRFEHSIGVMELAGRVYDVLTDPRNQYYDIKEFLPELGCDYGKMYWRRALRMAALCHDLGHLPFSHAAESELLPQGWDHERLTVEIIRSKEMRQIWDSMTPPLRKEDIAKLAVGPKKLKDNTFSNLEAILSEIIVGDAFGVDRMDYLLRDSHHAGVAYGKFDHFRLIDTLRILPKSIDSEEPALGVEEGGLHSAEALLLARYFMYTQLYFHPVRRIYDIHLKDFLKCWLEEGLFSTEINEHQKVTDNEVTAAILDCSRRSDLECCRFAKIITNREHFRKLYSRNPDDVIINPEAGQAIFEAAKKKFGVENVRHDRYTQKGGLPNFPVLATGNRISQSLMMSEPIKNLPVVDVDYVFIAPKCKEEAQKWLEANRDILIRIKGEEQ